MPTQFISEPIHPVAGAFDSSAMASGEPGFPRRFLWRDTEYCVEEVLEKWKETGACKSSAGRKERYLRKHCYRVRVGGGQEMRIYADRQPRQAKQRWWLHTLTRPAPDEQASEERAS